MPPCAAWRRLRRCSDRRAFGVFPSLLSTAWEFITLKAMTVPRSSHMARGSTIAISLYPVHLDVLAKLAKRHGSRSAAIQRLLETERRREVYRQLDEAYREYFSQPGAQEAEASLTEELSALESWPEEWETRRKGGKHGKRSALTRH